MLIDTTRVTRHQGRHALRNLDVVKAPVLGLVLNKINGLGDRYGSGYGATYGYSYAYRYDYDRKSEGEPARRSSGSRRAARGDS